jgi:SHS2 domain-containing protein
MTSPEYLQHVGEWKVAFSAPTLEGLFENVARFVAGECGTPGEPSGNWEEIQLSSRDLPGLLVDWANELVGRAEAGARAYSEVRDLRITGTSLEALVRGAPVAEWRLPIKAATYHDVRLEQAGGAWWAALLFDV